MKILLIKILFSEPWWHLLYMGIGGYIGYNKSSWEKAVMKSLNEKRVERGMPPIARENLFFGQNNLTKTDDPVVEEEVVAQES